ncbi:MULTISPECIES: UDP-glucose 4-epimerase GalE [Treponema]|uniref:UDP-glucose 4-epimerase n=1 Tax=Treponema succinifaciens (strain ATCC 33096 / DSM 2489 / 6091) TaxID=869209 RepID=F2NRL8_TRES6|nr:MULTISPECIES: UDP-glucose 4-epimerase GalE [Treponema]AEB13836.1 UDP-glucose 4-epimerase [Treponema succinifaciens DSM 2489]MCI6911982.1 UDP-glucose 4-epimerase GalE [Treponema succinifaciens]MDD6962142.1 UDP-glucose 4-epimerase GalE [Treponema succinifaciens]MDY5117486.1 UDP-glucose 4-epimerase GalE [Treponema succinifaciens]UKI56435.1 MAG: UDP-glucose 4-epimerase GalE [Treponema succinifaciens]
MKVLVIGGAGYIGSHVVKELMAKNHEVTVFDNLSSGLIQNLFKKNEFIAGDILHPEDLDKAFARGFDAFIHLAAFKAAGESMIFPEKYSINNINGTLNILNAAVAHNCLNMVFSSSAATFGEPQYLPIDENHPKNPENYYGFTKLKIEEFMGWYDKLKNLKFAALRYFNAAGYDPEGVIYGLERNPANLLPVMMEVACGKRGKLKVFGSDYDTRDGTCIRDYIHVTDLASAHVLALEYIAKNKKSLTLNLGTGKGITVTEMLEATRRITGKEIPAEYVGRRAGDPAQLTASSKLAKEVLGWEPKYSDVDTLIKSTYDAYLKYYSEN